MEKARTGFEGGDFLMSKITHFGHFCFLLAVLIGQKKKAKAWFKKMKIRSFWRWEQKKSFQKKVFSKKQEVCQEIFSEKFSKKFITAM